MPMRLELGAFTVEVERQEDAAAFVCGLLRRLNNRDVGHLMGVTDKTVRRWRREGRLPSEEGAQLTLLNLLYYLAPPLPRLPGGAAAGPATAPPASDEDDAPDAAAGPYADAP